MIYRLCLLMLCVFPLTLLGASQEFQTTFTLNRTELIHTDKTLIVRLSITTPRVKDLEMTRLEWSWHDQKSVTASNGMWKLNKDKTQRCADILIVAQVADATHEHPPMLLMTTRTKSRSKGYTYLAVKLNNDADIDDVFSVTVKPGAYALNKPITIGTLGGSAMRLSVTAGKPYPSP